MDRCKYFRLLLLHFTFGQHRHSVVSDLKVTSINPIQHIPLSHAAESELRKITSAQPHESNRHLERFKMGRIFLMNCWDDVLLTAAYEGYKNLLFWCSQIWQMEFCRAVGSIGRHRCLGVIFSGYKWSHAAQNISFFKSSTECLWDACW